MKVCYDDTRGEYIMKVPVAR